MTDDWAEAVRAQLLKRGTYGTEDARRSFDRYCLLRQTAYLSIAGAFDRMVTEGDSFLIQLISDMVADRLQGKT